MSGGPRAAVSLDELRRAFDRAFAQAPTADIAATDDLLAIRAGGDAYAVRLAGVAGIFAARKVAWMPSPVQELLGLVGIRGAILPVYDLCALLGYPGASARRWLLVTAGKQAALAFDHFDGHLRVAREAIEPQRNAGARARYVREIVRTEAMVRPVLDVASILERIETLVRLHHTRSNDR